MMISKCSPTTLKRHAAQVWAIPFSLFPSHDNGGSEGLYELAVLKGLEEDWEICYDTPITDDVMGHLTPEDIDTVLNQVESL